MNGLLLGLVVFGIAEQAPVDLRFSDSAGRDVSLREIAAGKPVVLTLAYYTCPMLCGIVAEHLGSALQKLDLDADSYRLATVSFDPNDSPARAMEKQRSARALVGSERNWSFLVGRESEIQRLAAALGFVVERDASTGQFAHPASVFVLTADGRVASVLDGVALDSGDLRLAIVEAGAGEVGGIFDRILLKCFAYDPATRRYAPVMNAILRGGALLIFAAVASLLLVMWQKERRRA